MRVWTRRLCAGRRDRDASAHGTTHDQRERTSARHPSPTRVTGVSGGSFDRSRLPRAARDYALRARHRLPWLWPAAFPTSPRRTIAMDQRLFHQCTASAFAHPLPVRGLGSFIFCHYCSVFGHSRGARARPRSGGQLRGGPDRSYLYIRRRFSVFVPYSSLFHTLRFIPSCNTQRTRARPPGSLLTCASFQPTCPDPLRGYDKPHLQRAHLVTIKLRTPDQQQRLCAAQRIRPEPSLDPLAPCNPPGVRSCLSLLRHR